MSLTTAAPIHHLSQHLNLLQEKFAAQLGGACQRGRREQRHRRALPLAFKLIPERLNVIDETRAVGLEQYSAKRG